MDSAIRTHALGKDYGRTVALRSLDLDVPRGDVVGYLGPNGAGKTTTIRLLMGLLRPTRGRAEVLGSDTVTARDQVHRRVGYLSGEFAAYPDLTGEQFLRYLGHLRGGVAWTTVRLLAKRFDLDLERRIKTLSHGNRQKVGLVQAVMHEPELLILDEPTSGLDPLMQQEFRALVREQREAGRTVFLSSHVLSEVEEVADSVAILRDGELLVVEAVDALKTRALRQIDLVFRGEPPLTELQRLPEVRDARAAGPRVYLTVEGSTEQLLCVAAPYGVDNVVTHEPDLEEIFLAYYTAGR